MRIAFSEVQKNITEIANRSSYSRDVLFELMAAYGRSATSITKLRNGALNVAVEKDTEVLQRGVVYFKETPPGTALKAIAEGLRSSPLTTRFNPRYIIVSDYEQLVAIDTKKSYATLDVKVADIDRHVDFFYGWTGNELQDEKTEAVVDRRAADKMKELYYELQTINKQDTDVESGTFRHNLNVFFSRLLFCFFAEDTRVFSKSESSILTNSIKDYTLSDGSDLDEFLGTLFRALDCKDKATFSSPFSKFPYVNGSLFDSSKHVIFIPKFNAQARKLILDCGRMNWAEINPDIFGSMFQSIVAEDHRGTHQMHYTSVPNILKIIEPLFLDAIREEFDNNYDNPAKLKKLLARISNIKIFDPACGSGNFLIIAYKELRRIEHAILELLLADKIEVRVSTNIKLDNFYGIEIDDFAHELAILSLYLAKHQMNIEFEKQFGKVISLIPLKDKANIRLGNAARLDWEAVCPNKPVRVSDTYEQEKLIADDFKQGELIDRDSIGQQWEEIFLISNPPYQGARLQNDSQKSDVAYVFEGFENCNNLDYVAPWYKLGVDFIRGTKAKLAYVSTNSICQGEQVALLWPYIFEQGLEIGFAHTSFKWSNAARNNAGVFCIVVGLRNKSKEPKYLFSSGIRNKASSINAYLSDAENVFVAKRSIPLSKLPTATFGSSAIDGGHLILTEEERKDIIATDKRADELIKKLIGAEEYINGQDRYVLWINDDQSSLIEEMPLIQSRVERVRQHRLDSKRLVTQKLADTPYRFGEIRYKPTRAIIIPNVTSERREYIPIGYLDKNTIITNGTAIYDAELHYFALLTSAMHMAWVHAIAGRLKSDYRYSASLVYNTFPVPPVTEKDKENLAGKARRVLFARENHTEKTLAEIYDPDKMPEDLRNAHVELDIAVDRLYRQKPYTNNEERLADLFALYKMMIESEKADREHG